MHICYVDEWVTGRFLVEMFNCIVMHNEYNRAMTRLGVSPKDISPTGQFLDRTFSRHT